MDVPLWHCLQHHLQRRDNKIPLDIYAGCAGNVAAGKITQNILAPDGFCKYEGMHSKSIPAPTPTTQ